MNQWMFVAMELSTYAFAMLMAYHALLRTPAIKLADTEGQTLHASDEPNRWRWLSTLGFGILFGQVVEFMLITTSGSDYVYGKEFLVMLPNPVKASLPVPLWIGVGWGVVLYSTTWTAQRLKQLTEHGVARALYAGLLAVNIDLALDPVANICGFWRWKLDYPDQSYHGVPFDNFICWFVIVASYTYSVRWAFKRWGKLRGSVLWVPAIGSLLAFGIVAAVNKGLESVYKPIGGDAPVFMLLFAVACVVIGRHARQPPHNLRPSGQILAVPIYFQLLCWVLLVITRAYSVPGQGSLLLAIPLGLAVGVFAYGWASLDRLLPRRNAGANAADGFAAALQDNG